MIFVSTGEPSSFHLKGLFSFDYIAKLNTCILLSRLFEGNVYLTKRGKNTITEGKFVFWLSLFTEVVVGSTLSTASLTLAVKKRTSWK